jgi:hypothetical protein
VPAFAQLWWRPWVDNGVRMMAVSARGLDDMVR